MKDLLKIAVLFISINTVAQTDYLKGYFISNDNQKTDCLIKNIDWKNNPTEFDFKVSETEPSQIKSIIEVQEFAIIDNSKYVRATLDIDTSTDNIQNYTTFKDPVFINKTVFLKVLVEGSNSLFVYNNNEIPTRFFYGTKTMPIGQLIYKKYIDNDSKISINENYKRQLLANVKCPSETTDFIILNRLDYNQSEMIKYFLAINKCNGDVTSKQTSLDKKSVVNYKAVIGLNNSALNLDFKSGFLEGKINMGKNLNFCIGFEAEVVLPYNNNSWSVFIQPTYNSYEANIVKYHPIYTVFNTNITTIFKYIQVPIGVRKYFYLNTNSNLYCDIAFNMKFGNNASKIATDKLQEYSLNDAYSNYAIGIGYQFKKINMELRYFTTTNLNSNPYYSHIYNYDITSIILKYKLF